MSNTSKRNVVSVKSVKSSEKITIVLLYSHYHATSGTPTPLVQVGKEYLFESQVRVIEHRFAGMDYTIVPVIGHEAVACMNKMPDHLLKIENERYQEFGEARSIGIALRAAPAHRVVVIDGDWKFNQHCLNFSLDKSCLLVGGDIDSSTGMTIHDHKVELMSPALPEKYGGIAYFTGSEASHLRRICWNQNKYKLLMFEVVNEIINKGSFEAYSNPYAELVKKNKV